MVQLVILQQDVWGAGGFKCRGCAVLYCLGVLVGLVRSLQPCGKVVHALLDLGWSSATLAFCVRDTEATHRWLFVAVRIRVGAQWCSSCWTLSLYSRWQISSPWMEAHALPVQCPASWIQSLSLPPPLLSTLLCLTFQGNAREVILITSKWIKSVSQPNFETFICYLCNMVTVFPFPLSFVY